MLLFSRHKIDLFLMLLIRLNAINLFFWKTKNLNIHVSHQQVFHVIMDINFDVIFDLNQDWFDYLNNKTKIKN